MKKFVISMVSALLIVSTTASAEVIVPSERGPYSGDVSSEQAYVKLTPEEVAEIDERVRERAAKIVEEMSDEEKDAYANWMLGELESYQKERALIDTLDTLLNNVVNYTTKCDCCCCKEA